ncbi:hypothetical protein HG531_008283 [Fusarium graminearum]|nr:hypothetical protein HG531_008283 [Fusarium graminearum]
MNHLVSSSPVTCVFHPVQQNILENIRKGDDALELVVIVDYYQTVNSALADSVKDGIQAIAFAACVNARALIRSLAQRLSNGTIQIFVGTTFDTGDDINRFKHIQHSAVRIDDWNTADVVFDHEMNDVKHRTVHLGCSDA